MQLSKLYKKFDSRCKSYSNRALHITTNQSNLSRWQYNSLTEVLLSDVWQSWCKFCRDLYLSSCRGCVARNGQRIHSLPHDQSWQRLGYLAKRASQNNNPTPQGHLSFAIRKEPTWGDIDIFLRIISRIQPQNQQTLLSAYGSFSNLKQLQRVRNACAHKNVETMSDVRQLSSDYSFHRLEAATDIAWKLNVAEGVFGVDLWIYEMNLIADIATSSA